MIYLKVATVPGQSEAVLSAIRSQIATEQKAVCAPGNYKDSAKIAEYVAAKQQEIAGSFDERWAATALNGATCEIIAVAVAVAERPPKVYARSLDDSGRSEASLLCELFDYLDRDGRGHAFCGHGTREYDLRWLFQRAVINRVNPGPALFHPKLDAQAYDTQEVWAGRGRVPFAELCTALGVELDVIPSAEVWPRVRAGDYAAVEQRCFRYVEAVREIYRLMAFMGDAA